MNVLFVLVTPPTTPDDLLANASSQLGDAIARQRCRRYPRADSAEHLHSLVCSMRDRAATTWIAGMAKATAIGVVLGGITNGVLAGCFDMLGGLLEIAIPLGCVGGGFLGGFSAAMRGTETPCPEVLSLLPHVRPGSVLVSWSSNDLASLEQLRRLCGEHDLPTAVRS